jgi:hypothetical protein
LPPLAAFAINIQGPAAYAGTGITVNDSLARDLDPTAGQILLTAGLGGLPTISGFSLNIDIGGSNSPGQVTASGTDFTFPLNAGGGSVTAQQWVNLANPLFGLGRVTPGQQGAFNTITFSNTASTAFTSATLYSIMDRLDLPLEPNASTAGDLQSTVAPEPVTMFLGGTGLLVLIYAARRRLFGR